MSAQISEIDAKAGACKYVLVGLLQQLDSQHPGMIDEMLRGVIADFAAIESNGKPDDAVRAIVEQAKTLLQQAGSYKTNQPT